MSTRQLQRTLNLAVGSDAITSDMFDEPLMSGGADTGVNGVEPTIMSESSSAYDGVVGGAQGEGNDATGGKNAGVLNDAVEGADGVVNTTVKAVKDVGEDASKETKGFLRELNDSPMFRIAAVAILALVFFGCVQIPDEVRRWLSNGYVHLALIFIIGICFATNQFFLAVLIIMTFVVLKMKVEDNFTVRKSSSAPRVLNRISNQVEEEEEDDDEDDDLQYEADSPLYPEETGSLPEPIMESNFGSPL